MYAEIIAAIQSAKAVTELAKTASSLSNYNELIAAVADVNARLMEATAMALASQERHSELLAKVSTLEAELNTLRLRASQTDRYSLHKFPTGSLAYRLKDEFESDQPAHFLCANCVDTGGHTKLQPWGSRRFKCVACGMVIQAEHDPPPRPLPRRSIY
jgi:hypothetical protein